MTNHAGEAPNPTAEKVIADAITAYWADEERSGPNRGPEAHDRECGIDAAKALRAHGLLSEGAVCEHQNEDYLRMTRERDEALAKLSEGASREEWIERAAKAGHEHTNGEGAWERATERIREIQRARFAAGFAAAGVVPQEPSRSENAAVARSIRLWTRQVRSELEATREANINLGKDYLEGMDSALRQAEERAARIENDLYGDAPAPSPDREKLNADMHDAKRVLRSSGQDRLADVVEQALDALAARLVLDEGKLAEVIGREILSFDSNSMLGTEITELTNRDYRIVARVIIEAIRDGEL